MIVPPPYPVIAIDGPAASGKSTFGKTLAAQLGYAFVSTGSMYRGLTWYLQSQGIDLANVEAVTQTMRQTVIVTQLVEQELSFFVAGIDPLPHVREAGVNEGVSIVAKVPEVRRVLVEQQQKLNASTPLIMEGRDIGTAVFPQTPYKFYLDADPAIRAARRQQQGELDSVQKRDQLDQQRTASPLTCAEDAVKLDSGIYSVKELVEQALQALRQRNLAC